MGLFGAIRRAVAPPPCAHLGPCRQIGFVLAEPFACTVYHKSFSTKHLPLLMLRWKLASFGAIDPAGTSRLRPPAPIPGRAGGKLASFCTFNATQLGSFRTIGQFVSLFTPQASPKLGSFCAFGPLDPRPTGEIGFVLHNRRRIGTVRYPGRRELGLFCAFCPPQAGGGRPQGWHPAAGPFPIRNPKSAIEELGLFCMIGSRQSAFRRKFEV